MFKRIPYSGKFNDFESIFIDSKTMEIHQEKHHETYQNKLNEAISDLDLPFNTLDELLTNIDKLPEKVKKSVVNNGGGLSNHNLFFSLITPKGGGSPSGDLLESINSTWGSFDLMKKEFSDIAKSHFGSGWVFLSVNKVNKSLEIKSLPNQESPIMYGLKPILGLDIWEHAYYLHYQNRRPEYVDAFWNVVNWNVVNNLFNTD